MDILQFLSGNGLFVVLGAFVVGVVLYNKMKARRQFKRPSNKK